MSKNIAPIILAALIVIFSFSTILAVPPTDEVIQQLKDEGRYEQFLQTMADAHARGVDMPTLAKDGKYHSKVADLTTIKTLVILIDFPDKRYTSGLAAATQADFANLLFSEGVISTGSMREYYTQASNGQFLFEGDVAGWYTASENSSYYTNLCDGSHGMGPYPNNAQALVAEAIDLADADVDFSEYDNNGDGWVDGIFVVHAGTGYEETGNNCEIHSHQWSISAVLKDGVYVSTYSIEPEESPTSGSIIPIGVFCHEFGHVLGLPDLYDTDYSSRGCGRWAVMASGSYNNGSRTPVQFCAWSKYQLGWIDPVIVDTNMTDVEFPPAATSHVVYRLWKDGMVGSQYFLVENKQKVGFDSYIPGEGMLIWHVDDAVHSNTNDWHPEVFLEQADGRFDLQHDNNNGDTGDPFPGYTGNHEFDDFTTPGSKSYSNTSSQVAVWNISSSSSLMTANLDVSWSRPNIVVDGYKFSDTAYGNGDGIFEIGETVQLFLDLRNAWKDAASAEVTVTSDDAYVSMTNATSLIGSIASGATADNNADPIEFEVLPNQEARIDSFFVEITADGGAYTASVAIQQNIGTVSVLFVDDDNNDSMETYFTSAFYEKRKPYDRWDRFNDGGPDGADLLPYGAVIWFTGDYQDNPLMLTDIEAMKNYLNVGGNLFLSGQGIAKQLSVLDAPFLNNYLKSGYVSTQYMPIILTESSGPVFGGLDTMIIQGYGSAGNQTAPDRLTAMNGGSVEARYYSNNDAAAVSYSGDYKTVFFGFGFEGLGQDEFRFARRDSVMVRILDFFGEGGPVYVAGDANADGSCNLGDAIYIINYGFRGGAAPIPLPSGDANGDCAINLGDAIYIVNYIFRSGLPPVKGCV